ncbi:MAG: SH3 domain-containing protein [Alphaproteobacteria bacterium]|nr:SH3 domain-containing protein [Alphaproteobacteria bacterium]MDE2501040.1 SH3 domain-containing protein [Alphaproteobacteria bacterium]
MAHGAVGFGKKPATAGSDQAQAVEAPAVVRAIPLALGPLVSPYKKRGRLSFRIERLPPSARLSAGRNNGDHSWSLAYDELDELRYLIPESLDEPHTLAVRVIARDDGATLAVIEVPVLAEANAAATSPDADLAEKTAFKQKLDAALAARRAARLSESDDGRTMVWDTRGVGEHQEALPVIHSSDVSSRTDVAATRGSSDAEIRRLTDECAAVRAALTDRDAELKQMRLAADTAHERLRQEADAALSDARTAWISGETARFAEAEAQWRATAAKELSAATARGDHVAEELRRLRDEAAAARAALTDREAELAQMRQTVDSARARVWQETDAAVSKARSVWKDAEAARLTEAEAQWRAQSAKDMAAMVARYEKAEAALKLIQAGAAIPAERDEVNREIQHLRNEHATARAALASREAELKQARLEAEQMRENWRQEANAAVSKAKSAWEAGEAARLTDAEAQWRAQLTKAVAAARAEAARDHGKEMELQRLRKKVSVLEETLAERERALVNARQAEGRNDDFASRGSRIVIRTSRQWSAVEPRDEDRPVVTHHYLRDAVVAACVVASAIFFYPAILPYVPQNVLTQFSLAGSSSGETSSPVMRHTTAAPVAKPPEAVVLRDVNVRAEPSPTAAIILTMRHGLKVSVLKKQGHWTLVQGAGGNNQVLQGWVFTSFLTVANDDVASRR